MSRRYSLTGAVLAVALATTAWAGREYPIQAGEQVVADQLLIKMRPGTPAAGIVNALLRSATVQPLRLADTFVITIPGGVPPGIARQLAANSLVDVVEPNRIRKL